MLGIGCFGIVKLGCGWCCGDFHEKNWVGLGVGVSNCKKNWVGVVVGGCGQLKLGLGLGVAVHGLIGLGLWLGVSQPHFAHPCPIPAILLFSSVFSNCMSLSSVNSRSMRVVDEQLLPFGCKGGTNNTSLIGSREPIVFSR